MSAGLIGRLTRGSYPLHYRNDQAIVQGFRNCGFSQVEVFDPSCASQALGLAPSRDAGLVRVIEARV